MNQIDKKKIIKEAKRKYVKHKWLYVYVKEKASVPYEKSFFHKIIADSKKPLLHKHYILYIHEEYLTISSKAFLFEPIKVPLHDELWIELYFVFNLEGEADDVKLIHDMDDEPI